MLAYMKMAKCEDDKPWFASEKLEMKTQMETLLECNSQRTSSKIDNDHEAPLCLVKTKSNQNPHFTGSSGETDTSTSNSDLTSPFRVSVSSSEIHRFHDNKTHRSLINPLSLYATDDFIDSAILARALASSVPRRTRGEKKPIPEEHKDGKYYERRKRNNMAAKKSRDARKSREDDVARKASLLEKENAILRAQLLTLKEEADSLEMLLIQKRNRSQ